MLSRYVVVFVALCIVASGCKQTTPSQTLGSETGDSGLTKDDSVLAVAYAVRDAAEEYALENNGLYPMSTTSRNSMDKSIKDYLPGGQTMINPYNGWRYLPVDTEAADYGDVGYHGIDGPEWEGNGYRITALGSVLSEYLIEIVKEPTM